MNLRLQIAVLCLAMSLELVVTAAAKKHDDAGNEPPAAVVRMTPDNKFVPQTLTITAGQTVEWVTTGEGIHAVADDPELAQSPKMVSMPKGAKPFHSAAIAPGSSFRYRFTVPGTYRYVCVPHQPQMVGTVVVKPADENQNQARVR